MEMYRMRFFLAASLLILVLGCSSSSGPDGQPHQPIYGDISGAVYLEGTTQPLTGVIVSVDERSDTTAAEGIYEIDSITEGSHSLTASHADYVAYEQIVEISGSTVHDIELTISIEAGDLHGHVMHPVYGPVSAARVSIAGILDYSDINGYYMIPDVPVGLQTLTCTQPASYHDFIGSLYITNSDNEYDITMIRTVENRRRVTGDATIRWHSDSTEYQNENLGWSRTVQVYQYQDANTTIKSQIFMALPALPDEVDLGDLEAATLRICVASGKSVPSFWSPMTLVMRRVLSPWEEGTIKWNNCPVVDTDSILAKVKPPQSGFFDLDVLQIYLDGTGPGYGVRFALDSDENGIPFRTESIEMHSREAADTLESATVTFRYTH